MERAKKLIGICGVRIYEQHVMPFIQVLKRESEKKGIHLISFCGSSDSQENTEEIIGQYQLVELIRQVDICALVLLTETIKNESMLQKLIEMGREKNIPVFSLDRRVEGCYNLVMDNEHGFEQMVRHVVEDHGCRCVNMIAGDKGERFSEERIGVYRKVLEENSIYFEQERIGYGNYWEQPVTGVMEQFFASKLPFPQAIVCANDIMAHATISLLNERGMEVPEDVIVVGYDGTNAGKIFFPSMTTGAPDYKVAVERIYSEIDRCIETDMILPCDITVPVLLERRQSCGCEQKLIAKDDRRISKLLAEIGNDKWHMKAMHLMLSDTFGKKKIEDIFPIVRKHLNVWFDFHRYVYLKSELLRTYEVSEQDTEVTSILEGHRGEYSTIGKDWDISKFQVFLDDVLQQEKVNTILVHLLISGKDVYGFSVDGFEELIDWQIKMCGEFSMFLSHILHTVIHNYKMHRLNEEIADLSLRDPMTGIYNRRGFFHEIRRRIEEKENRGKHLFLFMVDMDGLKYINDNFGHAEGDFAITTLANVLMRMGKEEAICARLGGDEFMCAYIDQDVNCCSAERFSTQMEELLKGAEGVSAKPYPLGASVGLISEEIAHDLDLDAMIKRADDQMYQHKIARKAKRDR